MSSINLSGNASGSGTLTITSPNTNSSFSLVLPEEAGTITTSNSPYSTFRNRIINGDMRIAQRGTAAVTGNVTFPVDRWQITNSSNASVSAQQDSDVPTGQGFSFSTKYTVTTADASVTGTEDALFRQLIEGFNTSDLAWGTASAKTVTLSFWVRSSVTGTFGGALKNSGNTRSYPFTYSISAANTWEYKTITIAGETSGTWVADNGIGVRVVFSLGSGSDRLGTAGAWGSANYDGATGQTQLISTLNATWYITGVQLEVGSVATPFERRPYGTELSLCQRYFAMYANNTTLTMGAGLQYDSTSVVAVISHPVTMRTTPTIVQTTGTSYFSFAKSGGSTAINGAWTLDRPSPQVTTVYATISGGTAGYAGYVWSSNALAYFGLSSEL